MKSLLEFIKEANSGENTEQTSKDITFNFTGIDNSEETVKKLQELSVESGIPVSIDGEKATVSFSKNTFAQAAEIIALLKNFIKIEGKSTRRASSEQYAQKLHAFEDAVKEMDAFKDECEHTEDPKSAANTDDDIVPKADDVKDVNAAK